MDNHRSAAGNGEDHVGIPDDLRCKRSDGKQWRCTAMSMPDKTVCEKHYIQAKKRAANSALKASLKKAKRKPLGDSASGLESRSDDMDLPVDIDVQGFPVSPAGKKHKERISKNQDLYSPESPSTRGALGHNNTSMINDDLHRDTAFYEENWRSSRTSPPYGIESSRNISHRSFDPSAIGTSEEQSDGSSDSSDDMGGLTCHQCRRTKKNSVIWCVKCARRGYCGNCISSWYSDIPLEEIQRVCPACRGICTCKVCSRGDNLIKARIREIPLLDKLQYLYLLLSSVLPVVKQINQEQCAEVDLEKKLHGAEVVIERAKLNADEQMCCDCCRTPIVDYHRHCTNCSYDLCLHCCQDLRTASLPDTNLTGKCTPGVGQKENLSRQSISCKPRLQLEMMFPGWRANADGRIPCLPRDHDGCGYPSLTLQRIFKMNWVAKLVKYLEEMVNSCKVNNVSNPQDDGHESVLYCPSSQDLKAEGTTHFRKHWAKGKPVVVKQVYDLSSFSSWDPMVIWKEISETTNERMRDTDRVVKAVDCLDWSEVEIQLGQFMKGYTEGRRHQNGWPEMLKLKDWPSPSASEEFLLYQRPEFISQLPLLEFIHSKWGLLNVAAKMPHYSLQNDVGPKIFLSYGMYEELGRGDSVTNLHLNTRDMVYVLVHTSEAKLNGWHRTTVEKSQNIFDDSEMQDFSLDTPRGFGRADSPNLVLDGREQRDEYGVNLSMRNNAKNNQQNYQFGSVQVENTNHGHASGESGATGSLSCPGILWDVFRREDVPKLKEYLHAHWSESRKVAYPLYDDAVYLNKLHKIKLKEEFGVQPWSFQQYLGQAVFIPAGCPFQVRNLQSIVQLGLDFLSPESLGEAVKLAEEIRCLPNDHPAKLQMMEVGKISLYAASSAIKEVQKLVLDSKRGADLGFDDPNLTAAVSKNLENMVKQRQISCI
ncbi:hypothetical protein Dimus_012182 [Dionaea muscipula]